MPEAGAAAQRNAACPRCGEAFHCGAHEASCDCAHIALDAKTLAALRAAYAGCLCRRCLLGLSAPQSGATGPV